MKLHNDLKEIISRAQVVPGVHIYDSSTLFPDLRVGLPLLVIQNEFCKLVIAVNGAHIISFIPAGKDDLLWLSPKSQMTEGQPIRGGIPLCLPWVGPKEGLPLHGFARINDWRLMDIASVNNGETKIVFTLSDNEITRQMWPHSFKFEYVITVGKSLSLSLCAVNKSKESLQLAFVYHTYFNIGNVNNVVINGLENCSYLDRLDSGKVKDQNGPVEISGPIERLYTSVPQEQTIYSPLGRYKINSDCNCALVWNAWENDRNIPDMGEGNHVGYVCVERGNMANGGEILASGESYKANMVLSVI